MAHRLLILAGLLLGFLLCAPSLSRASGEEKGKWVAISDPVLQKLDQEGKKPAWPGMTGGIAVDRVSGDVYMVVCGQGLWKSIDHGKTFERTDGGKIGGRCETAYAIDFDPNGQRLACFMLDGNAGITLDGGRSWQPLNDGSRGQDVAAVLWGAGPPRSMIAIRHESGGLGLFSTNGGKSWKEIGKDFLPSVGIFDDRIVVSSKGKGILRSQDAGATWSQVSDITPNPGVVRVYKNIGYWLSKDHVIFSKDRGATWLPLGSPVHAGWGPYFGKTEKHLVVVGKEGFLESVDGGATWNRSVPLPDSSNSTWPTSEGGLDRLGWFVNFGWDPNSDIFYASKMGKVAVRYCR
jgi:photosystem II stability/assembly factor-like uncharacterized protein